MLIKLEDFTDYLKEELSSLTISNFEESIKVIKEKFEVMEYLYEKKMLSSEKTEVQSIVKKETNVQVTDETAEGEYYFKKRLMGGTIIGIHDSYVSESVVRNIGLESGDLVNVVDITDVPGSIRLVRKNEKEIIDSDFELYPYSTVKYGEGFYYCDEYYLDGQKKLKIDGIPYKYRINDVMVQKLKIKEGDMLDLGIAYDSPTYIKIVWKHQNEYHIAPKPSSVYKDKSDKKEVDDRFYGIDFEGRKILVAGCEPRKKIYESAIEQCNGEMVFMSGEESELRLKPAVESSDVVILLRDFLSHGFVKSAIRYAKKGDIPFTAPDGLGVQNLIFEVRKTIENS